MADATIDFSDLKCTGKGTCHGGHNPHPAFHDYPLLAWTHLGHAKHGMMVFTEDQKASVPDIAVAFVETPDMDAVAAKFGTSKEHVRQALAYASNPKCGFLGA